jgi:hypothetical protein
MLAATNKGVGEAGFEPATTSTQSSCTTGLCDSPELRGFVYHDIGRKLSRFRVTKVQRLLPGPDHGLEPSQVAYMASLHPRIAAQPPIGRNRPESWF